MKYKLLCDRCHADQATFKVYTNAYNSGKCFNCNGHGYILTKDEIKAKESHGIYLDTLTRKISRIDIESGKEITALTELKDHENKHKEENKEVYERFEKALNNLNTKQNEENTAITMNEFIEVSTQWEHTKTEEYRRTWNTLNKEYKQSTKQKEKAIQELQKAQEFYVNLMNPVNE